MVYTLESCKEDYKTGPYNFIVLPCRKLSIGFLVLWMHLVEGIVAQGFFKSFHFSCCSVG